MGYHQTIIAKFDNQYSDIIVQLLAMGAGFIVTKHEALHIPQPPFMREEFSDYDAAVQCFAGAVRDEIAIEAHDEVTEPVTLKICDYDESNDLLIMNATEGNTWAPDDLKVPALVAPLWGLENDDNSPQVLCGQLVTLPYVAA